ncbi:hypothetical protein [Bacillus taeanensis]|uniref:hypothetical protein n=1 Tax=Bacillus taeanensis TaxID=273032 RepID=UPI0015F0FD53|nr:hypothetical protein [Bacillus taeanensis]
METVHLIGKINEYKGKQELYKKQSPQLLKKLIDVAVMQSTKASNAIEDIIIKDKRLKGIMTNKNKPIDRSKGEISGYRDFLNIIHASAEAIPVNKNVILQLHRDLYKYVSVRINLFEFTKKLVPASCHTPQEAGTNPNFLYN